MVEGDLLELKLRTLVLGEQLVPEDTAVFDIACIRSIVQVREQDSFLEAADLLLEAETTSVRSKSLPP